MCLILSTQARPSSFYASDEDLEEEDEKARHQVESLLRLIVKLRNGGDVLYMDILSQSQGGSSGMGGRGDRRGYIGRKAYREVRPESRLSPNGAVRGTGAMYEAGFGDATANRSREPSFASQRGLFPSTRMIPRLRQKETSMELQERRIRALVTHWERSAGSANGVMTRWRRLTTRWECHCRLPAHLIEAELDGYYSDHHGRLG